MRVVFDLDGTLIDSAPDIQKAVNLGLAELGVGPLGLDEVRSFIGDGFPVLTQRVKAVTGLAEPQDALFDRLYRHYNNVSRDSATLYPGVREALAVLSNGGWQLGLCTNKPGGPTESVLRLLKLDGVFATVVTGDSLPERKPDPTPLLKSLRDLGTGPRVYVGDSEVDAETASRAKVPFVLFTRGYRKTAVERLPHDAAFDDFADLPELLSRIAK